MKIKHFVYNPNRTQTLDETGNWTTYKHDTDGDHSDSSGDWEFDQTRTHNAANELLTISGVSPDVSHDRNGNMTVLPSVSNENIVLNLKYDAWNRLIEVQYAGGDTKVLYQYDGRNFMIRRDWYVEVDDGPSPGLEEIRHFYYTSQWQCIEERLKDFDADSESCDSVDTPVTTLNTQYVWGLRYIDDLILRDRNTDRNSDLDERLYALHDPNWNVVALSDTSGTIIERYTYDAYGNVTYRNANFEDVSSSFHNWEHLYTTRRLVQSTGLMYYRNRWYAPWLGRFVNRDPIGYDSGDVNLYRYVKNNPIATFDSFGLESEPASNVNILERPLIDPIELIKAGIKDMGKTAYRKFCWSVGLVIYDMIRNNPWGSKEEQKRGADYWLHFIKGTGKAIKLNDLDMVNAMIANPRFRTAIPALRKECFSSSKYYTGTKSISSTLEQPFLTSLGGVSMTLEYQCTVGKKWTLLEFTGKLSDTYDWKSWFFSGSGGHRSKIGEIVASSFDLIQIATQCTAAGHWKVFPIKGEFGGNHFKCNKEN